MKQWNFIHRSNSKSSVQESVLQTNFPQSHNHSSAASRYCRFILHRVFLTFGILTHREDLPRKEGWNSRFRSWIWNIGKGEGLRGKGGATRVAAVCCWTRARLGFLTQERNQAFKGCHVGLCGSMSLGTSLTEMWPGWGDCRLAFGMILGRGAVGCRERPLSGSTSGSRQLEVLTACCGEQVFVGWAPYCDPIWCPLTYGVLCHDPLRNWWPNTTIPHRGKHLAVGRFEVLLISVE